MAALTLALVLTGCGSAGGTDVPGASSQPTSSSKPSAEESSPHSDKGEDTDLATAEFSLSWEDALDQAKQKFDGDVSSIELGWESTQFVYTVKLLSDTEEYKTLIGADSGEVLNEETEAMDKDDVAEKSAEVIDISKIVPWTKARDAALDAVTGRIDEWKLEGTGKGPHYQFDIAPGAGHDIEVTIAAYTGEVVSQGD
ncbi:Uncharacterized membrane protein YkoI [Paramicrobacterium humi]|uniref:Uncharacterized membrane protein YkoI n=1 Tax=Paramicrobacterium humi TaxID=640635 RepID=A0A1H4JHD5_9MICO|nr:Uncharacterized membrane protein YkoI [Microbacterium humi]